jgi:hypothetical protein
MSILEQFWVKTSRRGVFKRQQLAPDSRHVPFDVAVANHGGEVKADTPDAACAYNVHLITSTKTRRGSLPIPQDE